MATLKTIAEKAGVSVAAASVALSGRVGSIGVAEKTRDRILKVAEEEGYRPNPLATSLRTGRTNSIAIYMDEPESYLSHPHGARNFWMMCEMAGRNGYRVSLMIPGMDSMDSRSMDGCLVLNHKLDAPLRKQLERLARDVPVVSLYETIAGAVQVNEDISWRMERRRAAEYLYDLGHTHIVITHMDRSTQLAIPQMFETVAQERGLTVQLLDVSQTGLDRRYLSIDTILAYDPMPTAVFAIDDDYARALISRLHRRGFRVPEDVSVFSGSTMSSPSAMWPALTGLHIHFEREWESLFNAFVRMIEKDGDRPTIEIDAMDVELLERESCGAPVR